MEEIYKKTAKDIGVILLGFTVVYAASSLLTKERVASRQENLLPRKPVPSKLQISRDGEGFFFCKVSQPKEYEKKGPKPAFCGKPINQDGNILIIGGPGSGKTTGHVYPTMETWRHGHMVLVDVKGDMADTWRVIYPNREKSLQIFAPLKNGPGVCTYDPFAIMQQNPENDAGHAFDLAEAIVAIAASERDPVWKKSAQALLAGAFLCYFHEGCTFTAAMRNLARQSVGGIVRLIMGSNDEKAKCFVSKLSGASSKTMASIGVELNELVKFVLNSQVISSLTPSPDRPTLDWEMLNTSTQAVDTIIDVSGPALSQCAPLIRLMITQLIKSLSLRPQRIYPKDTLPPILVCIDEFPQLERMPAIISALTTLRSRGVTMALCVQSLASLDATYGHDEAKVIFDACSYKVIRRVSDVESQEYISKAIGSTDVVTGSPALSFSFPMGIGASMSYTRKQRPLVYPEELGRLKNPILITPYGACEVLSGKEYPQAHREALRAPHSNVWPEVKNGNAVPKELSTPALDDAHELASVHSGFPQENAVSWQGDKDSELQAKMDDICAFCVKPRSAKEIMEHCNLKARPYFRVKFLAPLLEQGRLRMTHPENPKHPQQRYCTVEGTVKTPC